MLFQGEITTAKSEIEPFGLVLIRQQLDDADEHFPLDTVMVLVADLQSKSPRYCWYDFNEAMEDAGRSSFFNIAVFSNSGEVNEAIGDIVLEWGPAAVSGCRLWSETVVLETRPEVRTVSRPGLQEQVDRRRS